MPSTRLREPLELLEQLGCIRYEDESVTIVSRSALRDYVCECYDPPALRQLGLDGAA
jgi:hypothetical protein